MLRHAFLRVAGHNFFLNFVGPAFAGWTLLARLRARGTRDAIRAWFVQSASGSEQNLKKNYDPTLSKIVISVFVCYTEFQ